MKQNLKYFWVFSLSFLILFDCIALPIFTDSGQTTLMYIIVSFILQVMNFILFSITSYFLKLAKVLTKTITVYLISEISFMIFSGKPGLFGLFIENYAGNEFAKNQAFYYSICCVLSSLAYYLYHLIKASR
jgi:hypothetical protein